MQNFLHDLRYALRMMQRNPGVTAAAVLALGLGIGANTAVFTVLNSVLLRPLPFPDSDRLMLVSHAPRRGAFGPSVGLVESEFLDFRRNQSFESVATYNSTQVSLTGVGEAARLQAANVTASFFDVLRVKPAIGRGFDAGVEHEVLLGDALWRSRFHGDAKVLGRTIKLDGVGYTVAGVMPPGVQFPNDAELWTPLEIRVDTRNSFFRPVVGRLRDGASREQSAAEFRTRAAAWDAAAKKRNPRNPLVARTQPLKELLVGDVRTSLRIFAGAVAFVLLIACVNVANLLLMRAESRRQEIAVRTALGAGRRRLVRQLLTESLTVSLAGGAVGILFALWGVPALIALAPEGKIPRLAEIHIDGAVLAFTLGVSLVTGLLFGAAPAFQAARRSVRDALSQSARSSTGAGGALRNALAAAEIALALVLLASAGLMMKSLWRLHAVDTGFQADNVLTASVGLPRAVYHDRNDIVQFHGRALEKLSAVRGVTAAAAVNWLPLGHFLTRGDVVVEGGSFPDNFAVDKMVVSANYFRAMGIRILGGRDFSERDAADAPQVAIVSRSAADAIWPGQNPLGKRISEADKPKAGDWCTIVGVVDDVRHMGPAAKADAAVYHFYRQTTQTGWMQYMTYVARTADGGTQLAPAIRAAVHAVDADIPVERMASMQEMLAGNSGERTFQARLLGAFALAALVLAAIGVYGVLAYAVTIRTREIGIRMALGAEAGAVVRMVMRRTAMVAGVGLALGAAGALFATRVLTTMLFEVKPNDGATFAAAVFILGAAALAAGWIPARRASRVDPLVALRWE
jgi:putative ABC transport system permease protein